MSTPFDPTKLDLDINKKESEEKAASRERKVQKLAKTSPSSNNSSQKDILESMDAIDLKDPLGSQKSKEWKMKNEKNTKEPNLLDQIPDTKFKKSTENKSDTKDLWESIQAINSHRKLIDINIASLEDLVEIIEEKKYDYVIVEPEDMQVKIIFKQDNIDRDIKYVKFPVYTNILFKIKQIAALSIESTGQEQEWKWKLKIGTKSYKISAKTAPGQNGERIWIKSTEDTSQKWKKKVKKTSLSMIFGFLWAILFVSLILGGAFIAFIVLNAKTVEDVKFFASLGINLNDINTFISHVVTLIFSILLFLSTAALSLSLFKFFLTKKIFKRKKVIYWLTSLLLLLLTFVIGSTWMVIDQKIKWLPNWQEQAYGDLKIFDTSLLISKEFTDVQALISQTENLIGPITLTFDLKNFQNNQARKWLNIKKYIWNFGDETIESLSPTIIKTFKDKWNYEISVTAIGEDLQWEEVSQEIANIPAISISNVIEVKEVLTNNGGKKLSFDASDLKNLWKVEWYFKQGKTKDNPNPSYPDWTRIDEGYEFIPGKIFFDEVFVGVSILSWEKKNATIDKIIVISPDRDSDISGTIEYSQDIVNELSFNFFVKDPSTNFSNGFIENYTWTIEEKTYSTPGDFSDTGVSPEIKHVFKSFWEHEIKVVLSNSKGKTKTLTRVISIQKSIELKSPLIIRDSTGNEIENIRYEKKAHEYYIDNFWIPSTLKIDARRVRSTNILYSLKDVSWDIGNDGDIDARGKTFNYKIPTEWNHIIAINYNFVHRKKTEDTIKLKEYIYIEWIKKEAVLNLKIEKDSNYAPVTVRFDASSSFIKNDDIIKFIYDYGDGISEERDAINPWHKYTKAGDYTVSLTVIGSTGKTYSTQKKLILLPPPQEVKISTSLRKAPVWQGIDFSSAESEWQIVEYFWDFGDGNVSTEANPTYSYNRKWNYTVRLRVDFANKNSITDETEIEIYEEK